MEKQQITISVPKLNLRGVWPFVQKWLLPNPGTLILMLILALAVPVIARPFAAPMGTSLSTIPYQGRLADASGNPITDRQNMEFRLYDTPVGGTPLWEEFWTGGNSVNVSDGLFSVMLGSINTALASVVQGNGQLYLGITVGTDTEMSPRVQLGSVPFSLISLTVPDGSITSEKIATDAITTTHLLDGAITSEKLAIQNGRVILANNQTVITTAAWQLVPIPGLSFDIDLDSDSAVLVWYTISAQWSSGGDNRIRIWAPGGAVWNEQMIGGSGNHTLTNSQIIHLPAGTHTITLLYKAQYVDSQLLVRGEFSSMGYLVLGSE